MQRRYSFISIITLILLHLFSCSQDSKSSDFGSTKETAASLSESFDRTDYEIYLSSNVNPEIKKLQEEYNFWEEKLKKAPGQFPWKVKLASAANQLFALTGDIQYLTLANDNLESANKKINRTSAAILRSSAKTYITQHRFKESHQALLDAEVLAENLDDTNKMLFDINMELGDYDTAESYLNKIEEKSSFDHLIRKSKWEDHIGNLDRAIIYMESALKNAKLQKNEDLIMWTYTNLADYYGHAGRIEDSYNHYLKALEYNPYDAYAMKGIAWILYSHKKDTKGAKEILNRLLVRHKSPDYLLLLAEIAEYEGNNQEKNQWIDAYLEKVNQPEYGVMYNKYKIQLLAEEKKDFETAQLLAQQEIDMRPTPQSYDLLAWAKYKAGNKEDALEIIESKVAGKSFEPELLYHAAEIYKANDLQNRVVEIKPELLDSVYELGPVIAKKIALL